MESHRSTVPMAWSTKPPSVSTSQRQRTGDGKANDPIFFTDDDSDNSEDGKGLDNDTAEASIFKEYLGIHGESNADLDLSKIKNLLAASKSGAVSCLICLERVRSIDPVWDCKVGCHAVFHLICIQEWARQASNAAAERSIARLSRDHFPAAASAALENSCWHCPKCRVDYTQSQIPREYRCYCGKVVDPANDPWGTPHTCGEICGRPLPGNCGHECVLLCHPGPCPPCPKLARSKCFCGASSEVRRCGLKDFSCNGRCSKQLSCGLHKCEEKCHRGPCPPCRKNGLYRCMCGKAERECLCSESEFQCENPCNQELGCRKHRCLKGCHSGPCGECELQGRRTCPCGKVEYRGLSCDDAVPTCGSTCEKMLHCSMHRCPERCHPGPCVDTCRTVTSKSCRCGSLKKQVPCHQDLVCDRKCQRVRDCGRHACKRRCCDGDCPPCSEICGRKLRCNNHKCPAPCHRGTCAPCPVTVRIACSCGETAFEVPCGTEKEQRPPRCSRQCSITPLCRHGPQSKQLASLKNRENEGLERLDRIDQLTLEDRLVLMQSGLHRAARSRQMVMDPPLLLEMLATWDTRAHVFHLPGGDLMITPRLVRRITGLPDHGGPAILDSSVRGVQGKQEALEFFTGATDGVLRRGIVLTEILRSQVPELRKMIVLVIMHRISHSTNYYDIPYSWMRVVQRVEAGERLNWAALVVRGMITRLDALAGRAHGDYPYCSILMCMLFDFYPRTAPRGPQRVLTIVEPFMNRWEMRWRGPGYHAERFAGGASVRELRAWDLVVDPYAGVAWSSDEEDEEEPEPEPELEPESLEGSGDEQESVEGPQGSVGWEPTPPTQDESIELVDSDQEEADEEIARRLEAYFPGIERHRLLAGAPLVAEAGHAWERAAMARDVIRAAEIENARLQGQVSVLQSQMSFILERARSHRSDSRSPSQRSSRSRQSLSVQQGSGQASRGEPSQRMPPPS